MSQAPLVFVYLGNQIPKYGWHSLALARRNFSGPIKLLTDRVPPRPLAGIDVVDTTPWYEPKLFQVFEDQSPLDALFRGGFWLKAVERFFVLEQFQRVFGERRFFHAELDVLILSLSGLAEALDSQGAGIFIPSQRPKRAIASLVYVNKPAALQNLLDFFREHSHLGNEMNMLGHFLAGESDLGIPLPTENALDPRYNSAVEPAIASKFGLIDAFGFGLWLLGYDPRNVVGTSWNKFREGAKDANLAGYYFRASAMTNSLEVSPDRQVWLPIRALHVHSKVFARLRFPGVLSLYAWVARFPFRVPITLGVGGLQRKVLTGLLSRRSEMVVSKIPRQIRFFLGGLVTKLVSQTPKILSERERRLALSFLNTGAIKSGRRSMLYRSQIEFKQSGLPPNLKALMSTLPRDLRSLAEFEVAIFLDSLGRKNSAVYCRSDVLVQGIEVIRGKKQVLFVTDQKHYSHSKHAITFWFEQNLNNRWSFVGPFQIINPDVVREMFPGGEEDVFNWAEMGLRAGMSSLSAFQSYGTFLFSRDRKSVRLAPFPSD